MLPVLPSKLWSLWGLIAGQTEAALYIWRTQTQRVFAWRCCASARLLNTSHPHFALSLNTSRWANRAFVRSIHFTLKWVWSSTTSVGAVWSSIIPEKQPEHERITLLTAGTVAVTGAVLTSCIHHKSLWAGPNKPTFLFSLSSLLPARSSLSNTPGLLHLTFPGLISTGSMLFN